MALASTLKNGEHIRVTLLFGALKGCAQRALELGFLRRHDDAAAVLAPLSHGITGNQQIHLYFTRPFTVMESVFIRFQVIKTNPSLFMMTEFS